MKSAYFPIELADRHGVCDLAAELKLLLLSASAHVDKKACGVLRLTDKVFATLCLLPSVGRGVATELARRGLAVYNDETREFFVLSYFEWNKTPAEAGENSPWAKAVVASLSVVICDDVRAAVVRAIASAPPEKIGSVSIPTNLTTALPRRGGQKWAPSELLTLLMLYIDRGGAAAGVSVLDPDALGALCSLQHKTVLECCDSLQHGGAILFDKDSYEVYVFARVKNANGIEQKSISEAVDNLKSRRLKIAAKKHFLRTFGQISIKSVTCSPKEKKLNKKKAEEENAAKAAPISPLMAATAAATLSENNFAQTETLQQFLDRSRAAGARVPDADLERDRMNIQKCIEVADVIGEQSLLKELKKAGTPLPTACAKIANALIAKKPVTPTHRSAHEDYKALSNARLREMMEREGTNPPWRLVLRTSPVTPHPDTTTAPGSISTN